MLNEPTQTLPYLDGWRGGAIIAVLFGHFGPHVFAQCGPLGVMLFFVLSGFFMSKLLFFKKVPLSTFFIRRFNRVVPTFWLYVLVIAVWSAILQQTKYVVPVSELLSTLFFLRTYVGSDASIWLASWPIGHIWSLNVEEHSYAYLAAIAGVTSMLKWRHATVAALLLSITAVICFIVLHLTDTIGDGLSAWRTHTETASLGLLAAATYHFIKERYIKKPGHPYLGLVALFITGFCFLPGPLLIDVRYPAMTLLAPLAAAVAVNHAADIPQVWRDLLSNNVLRWFGTRSFSIYLWQGPFYAMVKDRGLLLQFAGLAGALVVGALSYRFFEDPLRHYLNGRWKRREQNKISTSLTTQ